MHRIDIHDRVRAQRAERVARERQRQRRTVTRRDGVRLVSDGVVVNGTDDMWITVQVDGAYLGG